MFARLLNPLRTIWVGSLILGFVTGACVAWASGQDLRPGDLVFASMPCYSCDLIERTTSSPYSHVGLVVETASGAKAILMAVPPRVMLIDLDFLPRTARKPVVYARMRTAEGRAIAERAAEIAGEYLGRPYDGEFRWGDESLYCSELIAFAYARAAGGRSVFPSRPMEFRPYVAEWRSVMGGRMPPQGAPGVSPGDLWRSSHLVKFRERAR